MTENGCSLRQLPRLFLNLEHLGVQSLPLFLSQSGAVFSDGPNPLAGGTYRIGFLAPIALFRCTRTLLPSFCV